MNDSDDDKTKIRISPEKRPLSDGATRIRPDGNTGDEGDADDKTRLASARTDTEASDDVTRLAAPVRGKADPATAEDATRIVPSVRQQASQDAGATVLRSPPGPAAEDPDVTRFKSGPGPQSADASAVPPAQTDGAGEDSVINPLEPDSMEHTVLKNRFVLEKVLGVGGMGIVYKAKDLLKVEAQDRDPYVAIKVLSEEFKAHPEAFISLQRESRKSQRIAHPNIVNVHDFDRDGNTVFMTMEFLDGSPLDQIIRQYKSTGLPTDYAWDIVKGMSAALSYAHAEKIIHSDFKPGNVFVTKKGIAKVFDFGIARAVARVEHIDDDLDDKTVFDAGNLGALTPAYASLEMLEGKEPDVRDDIYALGCVTYELFTGEHPYNKLPADEAERQGLKPKRIANIKKSQWRAIEKAIAFRREDRIATVDQFVDEIATNLKAANKLVTAAVILVSVLISAYFVFFQEKTIDPYAEFDIRNELELKIKIDFYKDHLVSLIGNPVFSDRWQEEIWKDVSDLAILTKGEDPWVDQKKQEIYQLYLERIVVVFDKREYTQAKALIENATRYADNKDELSTWSDKIAAAIKAQKAGRKLAAGSQDRDKQSQQVKQAQSQQAFKRKQSTARFNAALDNVNTQLKCQNRLNMRDFETAINKLREIDRARYRGMKDRIVRSLASCITQMGKVFPERALEAKKHSLRIFKSNAVLASIDIKDKDPCDKSLAGLGARGKRAICKDKVKNAGYGPELVVVPGSGKIGAFAIGKYEISIDEFNKFCRTSSRCKELKGRDGELPASEISLAQVKSYLRWLSKQSGQKYRLPTKIEWVYAAKSRDQRLDANRNCKLNTRGIRKGGSLVKTRIGKQNKWGLVNYVGNVQEWVYDQGRELIAVGGSYLQSMEDCNISTVQQHNGQADRATGFRVLREMRS